MEAISSVSGVRYAQTASPHIKPTSRSSIQNQDARTTASAECELSRCAQLGFNTDPEWMDKVSSVQSMMDTLKRIESRTSSFKSFADSLLDRKEGDYGATSFGELKTFSQVDSYLRDQVGLLLGEMPSPERDLITFFKSALKLNASFAQDMCQNVAQQLLKGLDIILDLDTHQGVRVAKLLRNKING